MPLELWGHVFTVSGLSEFKGLITWKFKTKDLEGVILTAGWRMDSKWQEVVSVI